MTCNNQCTTKENTGWVCPRCENVISPSMNSCPLCIPPKKEEGSFSVGTQAKLLLEG